MAIGLQALTALLSGVESVFLTIASHVWQKVQLKFCHSDRGRKYDRHWCLHQPWLPVDGYTLDLCASDALARGRRDCAVWRVDLC